MRAQRPLAVKDQEAPHTVDIQPLPNDRLYRRHSSLRSIHRESLINSREMPNLQNCKSGLHLHSVDEVVQLVGTLPARHPEGSDKHN